MRFFAGDLRLASIVLAGAVLASANTEDGYQWYGGI